jgi:hypothetical protein
MGNAGLRLRWPGAKRAAENAAREKDAALEEERDADLPEIVAAVAALSARVVESASSTAQASSKQSVDVLEVISMGARIGEWAEACAQSSARTSARIREALARADRGTSIVEELVGATADSFARSSEQIRAVASEAKDIDGVLELISRIASQTRLLALNSAVEAARAGEHGKAFSVVAQEIRALSDQTAKATEEISRKLGVVRESSQNAVKTLDAGRTEAEHRVERASDVKTAFVELSDSITEIDRLATEVTSVTSEQIAAVNEMSRRGRQIAGVATGCAFEADASAEFAVLMISEMAGLRERVGVPESDAERNITAASAYDAEVRRALEGFSAICLRLGPPAVRPAKGGRELPALLFGGRAMNDRFEIVDEVNRLTGLTATLFVRTTNGFFRISTNVKKADGSRAVGTQLNPKGLAMRELAKGRSHHGYAYILGKPFYTGYEPIIDAGGTILGAWYAGKPLS